MPDERHHREFQPDHILVAAGHTYVVTKTLGKGGMGTVYLCRDRDTWLPLAIKVLHEEYAYAGCSILERFHREARIPGHVGKHIENRSIRGAAKYLLTVTAIGDLQPGDLPYYAMRYLTGCTLQQQIEDVGARARNLGANPGLPVGAALNILIGLLFSLQALHQCGVVHRDLKPANIFLHKAPGEPPSVVVLDYGIAHLMDQGSRAGLAGSTGYIAPECFRNEVSPASDIFSVGVILFTMLAGVKPASRMRSAWPEPGETRAAPSLAPLGIMKALADVTSRCLALDPDDRPGALELSTLLQEIALELAPVDVGTAVTEEDDQVHRTEPGGASSTALSVAECSPATSPDLDQTERMNALREVNEKRAARGLPLLTHLPNNETTPMAKPAPTAAPNGQVLPPVVAIKGPRQSTVPMNRGHLSPIAMPPPKEASELVTAPPAPSSRSPEAFGPVSIPSYLEPARGATVPSGRRLDPIIAALPDRRRLAEALQRDAQREPTSVAALALTPRVEVRLLERLFAALGERPRAIRRALASRLAARRARQRREAEQAAHLRSERDTSDRLRQVAENRRRMREAEARGEKWTADPVARSSFWRTAIAIGVLVSCISAVGGAMLRRSALRAELRARATASSAVEPFAAPAACASETVTENAPPAAPSVSVLAAASAAALAVAPSAPATPAPRARPPSSVVRAPAAPSASAPKTATPASQIREVMTDFK